MHGPSLIPPHYILLYGTLDLAVLAHVLDCELLEDLDYNNHFISFGMSIISGPNVMLIIVCSSETRMHAVLKTHPVFFIIID